MEKPGELVKWSLILENSESAALMRIEFLVVAIAFIFLLMSFLDMFRRQSRHSYIKYLLLVLDAISDSTFIYTIGLMQSAPFKKDLFSVWALILVNLRFNACFISAYGIPDQDNSRINESGKISRSIYLLKAYRLATNSFLHGWSSPLLTAYMGTPDGVCEDGDPTTMKGYRFDDLPLPADSITHTTRLVHEIIGKNSGGDGLLHAERAFRIAQLELAFLNDYFYTRYPILFWRGFPLLCAWHPLLTIALIAWLARDIHKLYEPREGETAHVIKGVNVDITITWIFMGIIVLKELWKMVTYILSDWTKVMLLCEYTSRRSIGRWCMCIPFPQRMCEFLVRVLCTPRCTIVHRWHNKVGQYEFLQSFGYDPWNVPYYLSLGLLPKETKGARVSSPTELPAAVKAAVLRSICSLDLQQTSLESELPAGQRQFEWTFKLRTWCQTILVWHIATSLCEIELAQHYNTCLTLSEVLCAVRAAGAGHVRNPRKMTTR
ncbi:hypothetical protein Zm00014a_022555 [Zea mays]|uniref:DUF4220 domain-containing protein n=1 Tax=Zea mays TaxID=4577 RepID=A0A317YAB3_MAIZE|nr:hypothetical protein Zm00014a_022555 [Zea mays]